MRLVDADELQNVSIELSKKRILLVDMAPTVQAVPIPDNATNGDIIKTLFPKCMWNVTGQDEEWWNAPYEGSDTK